MRFLFTHYNIIGKSARIGKMPILFAETIF